MAASKDKAAPASTAAELVRKLNRAGVDLAVRGGNIRIRGDATAHDKELLRAHKAAVIDFLNSVPGSRVDGFPSIYGIPLDELARRADADWPWIRRDARALESFASLVRVNTQLDRGEVPEHWTERAHCQSCGPVPIFLGAGGGLLDGCPWCLRGGYRA